MSTNHKYPKSMIFFHSLLAVLMLITLFLGWNIEDGDAKIMYFHKSFGGLVLVFGIVRIINRMRNMGKIPASVNDGLPHLLEKAVHGLLMLTMIGLPMMGWLTSNAFGYPATIFGLNLPTLIGKDMDLAETLGEAHGAGAAVFVALLVLHVVGAIYHKVKTKEDVISRILPW